MNRGEAGRMALRNLWSHKLRSLLTVVGVLIGIGSVIAVVSLSAAFEASITAQFSAIDDRSIFVVPSAGEPGGGPPDAGQYGTVITEVDRRSLADLPGVERVVASGPVPVTSLATDGRTLPFRSLTATASDSDDLRDPDLYHAGGPFEDGAEQVVLGWSLALALGGDEADAEEPSLDVGDTVRVRLADGGLRNTTVAGVLAFQETLFGSQNGAAFVPLDPFYQTRAESPGTGETVRVYGSLTVVAAQGADIRAVRDAVDAYMERDSDAAALLEGLDVSITVATASDITDQIGAAFDQVTVFIAAIAGVSLLVGGIMIATIQLISVTERTKEIGLMKAIGALDRDVLRLFLVEAALIGLAGSLVGIAVGLGAGAAMVRGFFEDDVAFVVPYRWIAVAVGVGVLTGLVAGYLPARRATRIQPVEALNYE